MFPFAALSVNPVVAIRSTSAPSAILSLVSTAASASPLSANAPTSVVRSTVSVIASSALAAKALKVEAAPLKAIDALSNMAFRVTVPVMLSLFAPVTPSTVRPALVALPIVNPVAVIFCNSAPVIVIAAAAPAPNMIAPPSETLTVVDEPPELMFPVNVISFAVISNALLVVERVLPAATLKSPTPTSVESASMVVTPADVTFMFTATPLRAVKFNPAVVVESPPEKVIVPPAPVAFVAVRANVPVTVAGTVNVSTTIAVAFAPPIVKVPEVVKASNSVSVMFIVPAPAPKPTVLA